MKKMLSLMPLAAALALAGCVNLAPDYERPEAPVAQAWPEGESYANSELKREELPKWQNFIQDDRLKKVIELALSNNRDLRIAALNVEKARALYSVRIFSQQSLQQLPMQQRIANRRTPQRMPIQQIWQWQVMKLTFLVEFVI